MKMHMYLRKKLVIGLFSGCTPSPCNDFMALRRARYCFGFSGYQSCLTSQGRARAESQKASRGNSGICTHSERCFNLCI